MNPIQLYLESVALLQALLYRVAPEHDYFGYEFQLRCAKAIEPAMRRMIRRKRLMNLEKLKQ